MVVGGEGSDFKGMTGRKGVGFGRTTEEALSSILPQTPTITKNTKPTK